MVKKKKQRKQKNVKHKIERAVLLRRDVERQVMGKKHVRILNNIQNILVPNLGVHKYLYLYLALYYVYVCM